MSLDIRPLSPIGATVADCSIDLLLGDASVPAEILNALDAHGVLVFPRLGLDDETQLAFARRLGQVVVKTSAGWSKDHPGIYRVALDPGANDEFYVKASWDWHIDGATAQGIPTMASLLSCLVPPSEGGETQFASTYAAYDRLTDDEKARYANLKVWHRIVPEVYTTPMNLSKATLDRLAAEPAHLHPFVWTHKSGRKSLVTGFTGVEVEGMDAAESADFLRSVIDRATQPEHVLTHTWSVGDLVIWDNRGTMHRARPFTAESARDMHRVMLAGDEAIQ